MKSGSGPWVKVKEFLFKKPSSLHFKEDRIGIELLLDFMLTCYYMLEGGLNLHRIAAGLYVQLWSSFTLPFHPLILA